MRSISAVALAATLFVTNAYAATAQAPLASGKPAGVHQAQLGGNNTLFIVLGVGILAAGIGLAASGGDNNQVTPATTTTTTTTTTATST
jgi:hypothetical protein